MQKKTKVIFLTHPEEESEVFAAFINITEGDNTILSYQHIGQHSECSIEYVKECQEADDYASLLKELSEDVGYDNLVVMNKRYVRVKTNHQEDSYKYALLECSLDDFKCFGTSIDKDEILEAAKEYGFNVDELPIVEQGARVCSIKNKLMDSGYVWGDGTYYSSTKECTLREFRKDIKDGAYDFDEVGALELLSKTDKQLLKYAYENDIFYYTEWDIEEELSYYVSYKGEIYEVE